MLWRMNTASVTKYVLSKQIPALYIGMESFFPISLAMKISIGYLSSDQGQLIHLKMRRVKDRDFWGTPPPNLLQMGGSIGQVAEVQTKTSGLQMGQRSEFLWKPPQRCSIGEDLRR